MRRRTDEIRLVENIHFRYVRSEQNPADIASRGSFFNDLIDSMWFSGPPWLPHQQEWPPEVYEPIKDNQEFEVEAKILTVSVTKCRPPFDLCVGNYKDMHLLRVTAFCAIYLRKLASRCKLSVFQFSDRPINHAKNSWLRAEQNYHYFDVFCALREIKHHDLV